MLDRGIITWKRLVASTPAKLPEGSGVQRQMLRHGFF